MFKTCKQNRTEEELKQLDRTEAAAPVTEAATAVADSATAAAGAVVDKAKDAAAGAVIKLLMLLKVQ